MRRSEECDKGGTSARSTSRSSGRMVVVGVGVTVDEGTVLADEPKRIRSARQWIAPFRGSISEVSNSAVAVFVRDTREMALYCRLAGTVVSVESGVGIVVEGRGVAIAASLGGGGRACGPISCWPLYTADAADEG